MFVLNVAIAIMAVAIGVTLAYLILKVFNIK